VSAGRRTARPPIPADAKEALAKLPPDVAKQVRQRLKEQAGKPGPFEQYRDAFAENYETTARWRRDFMARKFPDDERHVRCATALESAAVYVSCMGPCQRLGMFFGLWGTPLGPPLPHLKFRGEDGMEPWELLADRLPSPSRFWFDKSEQQWPTTRDVDQLIADTFSDLFKRWSQHLPADLDGDVVEYFARRGRNLYFGMSKMPLPR
jgi:hypothetical protein